MKGMTYFFKDDKYWKFKNQEPQDDYPKQISEGFDGIPNNIDAALVWGGNGKIYFFKVNLKANFSKTPSEKSKCPASEA